MKTSFQEEFMNAKLLERVTKELRKEDLDRTIKKINFLYEQQQHIITKHDIEVAQRQINAKQNF